MWLKNFINELRAWSIVRNVYKKNKDKFLKMGIKSDWFGKLYTVINRDPEIELGSDVDEVYLHKETAKIWAFLVQMNIADILAYELSPLEEERAISETEIEYEHGYLIVLTPAWNLEQQYVTWKSVLCVFGGLIAIIAGICALVSSL